MTFETDPHPDPETYLLQRTIDRERDRQAQLAEVVHQGGRVYDAVLKRWVGNRNQNQKGK